MQLPMALHLAGLGQPEQGLNTAPPFLYGMGLLFISSPYRIVVKFSTCTKFIVGFVHRQNVLEKLLVVGHQPSSCSFCVEIRRGEYFAEANRAWSRTLRMGAASGEQQ